MERKNQTSTMGFILLGLSSDTQINMVFFVVFLLIYIFIIIGITLILTAIRVDHKLQTPMYFVLTNLSCLDMFYSTISVPKMLETFLTKTKSISFAGCVTQMYVGLSLGITECLLLMACDRYVAICYPLQYMIIMNRNICNRLAGGTWICGFVLSIVQVALTLQVPLCGHNVINHFACEIPAVLRLACVDVSLIEMILFMVSILTLIIPLLLILVSYIHIVISVLKIIISRGIKKAFSTCASHITVVVLFYGTAMYIYMKPQSNDTQDTDKIVTIVYCVITPLMNPMIYTLRNKEIKDALNKTVKIISSKII